LRFIQKLNFDPSPRAFDSAFSEGSNR